AACVAARAAALDLHLALSAWVGLLEHEFVVLAVDSAAHGNDPDLALLAQFEHVGEAAREAVHVHDDQHVELAPVIGREHVCPAGPGPSRLAPGGVIVLELVADPPTTAASLLPAVGELLRDALILVDRLADVDCGTCHGSILSML